MNLDIQLNMNNSRRVKQAVGAEHEQESCQLSSFGFIQNQCHQEESHDSDDDRQHETRTSATVLNRSNILKMSQSKSSVHSVSMTQCTLWLFDSPGYLGESDHTQSMLKLVQKDTIQEKTCEEKWPCNQKNDGEE